MVQEIASPRSSFFILFEDRKVSSWSSALHFQLFLSHSASKMSPSNLFPFSAVLFSFYLLPFPASVSFPMGQLFTSGGQSTGASTSPSVLLMNIQDWFPLGLTGLISLQSKGLSRVFSNTTVQRHQFFDAHPSLWFNSHIDTWTTGKTIALTRWTFVGKVMSLLFNMLSRFVIAFLPRNKCFLISWLQSPSTLILKPKKIISVTACTYF